MISTRKRSGFVLLLASLLALAASAQTPSPVLIVLMRETPEMAFVDPASGKTLSRLPTGKGPHEVIASPDGKLAFVAVTDDDNILVIDVPAQKEIRRISIGPKSEPHGMVLIGGKLYFTAQGYKLVVCYDLASNKIDWLFGTGQDRTHMLVMTKDQNTIFVSNPESDTVVAIADILKGTRQAKATVIPVGKWPEGIALSPDDKEVWVANRDSHTISIIDVAGKNVKETIPTQTIRSLRVEFTPDGQRALVADARGDFVALDAATRKEIKRLQPGGRPPSSVSVLPDGSRALIATDSVAVLDLKTLEITSHIPAGSVNAAIWVEQK